MAAPAAAPTWLDDADLAAQKHEEAVADAVEKCADDTKGQTCYICTEAVKEETNEGLVSGFCACRGGLSFAHVSCLARQAQVAAERRSGPRFLRWSICGLCEQEYHGVVRCALGWACWKTYLGRPETDEVRGMAMSVLANGLSEVNQHEEALPVYEVQLSLLRRFGGSERDMLRVQGNLANTYQYLGRHEQALRVRQEVYSGNLKFNGEEHQSTLIAAINYSASLANLRRFEEARAVLRKMTPVARRDALTLQMRANYARTLYESPSATLDDLREAVTTLEETAEIARHVLGGAHPVTTHIKATLREAREAREAPVSHALRGFGVSAVFFAVAAASWKRGAVGWAVIWLIAGTYVASLALYAAAVIARCGRRDRVA